MDTKQIFEAIDAMVTEKHISKPVLVDALKSALERAYVKQFKEENVQAVIDPIENEASVFAVKTVSDDIESEVLQISLEEAKQYKGDAKIGDEVLVPFDIEKFNYIAISTAKQIISQKIREEERDIIIKTLEKKKDDIITGKVTGIDDDRIYVQLPDIETTLFHSQLIPGETLDIDQNVDVLLSNIESSSKSGIRVFITRKSAKFLEQLLKREIPEIFDGTVEIKGVARDAGKKSKIAVKSNDYNIDAIGSIIGSNNSRIHSIIDSLNGEKIEVVAYSDNTEEFIANALSPASVVEIITNEEEREALVIVPDTQISLAIGAKGINTKLAVQLTNWKIDIKTESEAKELGLV